MMFFLYKKKKRVWLKAFTEKYQSDLNIEEREYQSLSSSELSVFLYAAPFLGDKRLCFLSGVPSSAKDKKDEKKETIVEEFLTKGVPDDLVLICIQPTPDKRTRFYKKCVPLMKTEIFSFPSGSALSQWVRQRVALYKGAISSSSISYLIEKLLETNLFIYDVEIQKLCLYVNGKEITKTDIDDLVVAHSATNIFRLLDMISAKRPLEAIKELHVVLDSGEGIFQVLYMLVKQFRNFIFAMSLKNPSSQDLVKECKMHPFVAKKVIGFLRNMKYEQVKAFYLSLLKIDEGVKTGKIPMTSHNEKMLSFEIEKAVVKFCT